MDSCVDGSVQPRLAPALILHSSRISFFSPLVQETTQALLRLVHDAAFETALRGQIDEDRETVESILQSALNILEGKALA